MDYQCIVVYTIVRISPFYPYTTEWPRAANDPNGGGCLDWLKTQIKRLLFLLLLFVLMFFVIFVWFFFQFTLKILDGFKENLYRTYNIEERMFECNRKQTMLGLAPLSHPTIVFVWTHYELSWLLILFTHSSTIPSTIPSTTPWPLSRGSRPCRMRRSVHPCIIDGISNFIAAFIDDTISESVIIITDKSERERKSKPP